MFCVQLLRWWNWSWWARFTGVSDTQSTHIRCRTSRGWKTARHWSRMTSSTTTWRREATHWPGVDWCWRCRVTWTTETTRCSPPTRTAAAAEPSPPSSSSHPVDTGFALYIRNKVKYTDIAKFAGHLPHRYGNSHAIWDHTVLPATRQRWHSRLYPSRSWYSIRRPRRDARLSWLSWLVTARDGVPARRRSPIPVVTGPDVR